MTIEASFEWDEAKDAANRAKHGVGFDLAQRAFLDPRRIFAKDAAHSADEPRLFCIGMVDGRVMTVRFTHRNGRIRLIGAGFWRGGRKVYEQENGLRNG